MNRVQKHLLQAVLVIVILLIALFILGDTSFDQVTRLIPTTTQTAAVYNVAQDSPELLANGNMESATAWNDSGGTIQGRSAEQAHGGTYSWKVSYPSCCGWAGVSNSLNIPNVSAGQIYRLSGWVYVTSGSVRIAIKDFSNHTLGSTGITTPGTWQYVEAYATILSGVADITAMALFDNSSGTFYMDDFSLKLATSGTDTGTGSGGITPQPTCQSFIYSSWGTCSSGSQTRTVTSTSPSSCIGGTPVTTQSCTVDTPAPDNPTNPIVTGDQIAAASCSRTDVQVAFDAAKIGDTVTIPAGTCTWTSVFNFNKAVTLKGAGIGQTTIINGVSHASDPNTGTHPQIMVITSSSAGLTRLTDMTIDGGSGGSDSQNNGFMKIQGSSKNWRIDHVRFVITRTSALHVWAPGGVIDHNRFDLVGWYMAIYGFNGGGGSGDPAWAQPTNLGTDDALYIEDNTFYSTTPSLGLDGWVGQRVVVRYNNFNNSRVGNHGTESSQRQRGARSYEIYNNTFTLSNTSNYSDAIGVRSGVGVIFNNTLSGAFTMVGSMHNYRDPHPYPPWGQCDGTSPFDLNDVNDDGTTKVYDSGVSSLSASSINQSITLTAQKAWTPSQWVGYTIWNTRTNVKSPISSNTATTLVGYTDNTNNGTPLSWSVNDPFKIVRASVCLDQVGRGKGDLISGSSPTPQAWPHQELDPTYIWNNTLKGSVQSIGDTSVHIVENRDYYNNTCKPGYTPYTYPHPLTGLPAQSVPLNCSGGGQTNNYVPTPTPAVIPPVTPSIIPPVVPAVIPPVVPQLPIVPTQLPVTPTTPVNPVTPAVPSIISRVFPSFTSPTRTPTTPSSVTTRRTNVSGPFVPLPENTPEDISSTTPRTSIIATIKDIFSYVIERIWRGVERVMGR